MINIAFINFDFVIINESTLNSRVNNIKNKIAWIWYKYFRKMFKILKLLFENIVFKKCLI